MNGIALLVSGGGCSDHNHRQSPSIPRLRSSGRTVASPDYTETRVDIRYDALDELWAIRDDSDIEDTLGDLLNVSYVRAASFWRAR